MSSTAFAASKRPDPASAAVEALRDAARALAVRRAMVVWAAVAGALAAISLVPIVLWVCQRGANGEGLQPFVPELVVLLLLAALLERPDERAVAAEALT